MKRWGKSPAPWSPKPLAGRVDGWSIGMLGIGVGVVIAVILVVRVFGLNFLTFLLALLFIPTGFLLLWMGAVDFRGNLSSRRQEQDWKEVLAQLRPLEDIAVTFSGNFNDLRQLCEAVQIYAAKLGTSMALNPTIVAEYERAAKVVQAADKKGTYMGSLGVFVLSHKETEELNAAYDELYGIAVNAHGNPRPRSVEALQPATPGGSARPPRATAYGAPTW